MNSAGDDLNHYVKTSVLESTLILGGEIAALCGARYEPELRVGSSGCADDPDMEICPACERIYEALSGETSKQVPDELDEELRELLSAPERAEVV